MSRRRHPDAAPQPAPDPTLLPGLEPSPEVPAASPAWHPALLIAFAVAALGVLISVTHRIGDYDLWQHLAIGKAIWQTHAVPDTHLWSWPIYGTPAVLPSWGFRAALWPFWSAGGVVGLFAWRWLMALATFAAVWAASRQAGARGLAPLVVLVLAALTYGHRVHVDPESIAVLLLALELWALETRRAGAWRRFDPAIALIPIAWVWANTHDTWWIGLGVLVVHLIGAAFERVGNRRATDPEAVVAPAGSPLVLLAVVAIAIGVSFLNPFGMRVLWPPLAALFAAPSDALAGTDLARQPLAWSTTWRSGLPLIVIGWPLLIAWRALRRRLDVAELLLCIVFLALLFKERRFAPFAVVAAAPYLARDLDAWIGTRRWPGWTVSPAARAAIASVACMAVGVAEWTRPGLQLGVGLEMNRFPVKAADFIAETGIRGHGFVPGSLGGYQLWRFWPERERLPFMDVEMKGTPEDRELVLFAFSDPEAWRRLDDRHRFDYALLDGHQQSGPADRLLDVLDADSTWSLVFRDDDAAIYVRRGGALDAVARDRAFGWVPGGEARVPLLGRAIQIDPEIRQVIALELDRQIQDSPANARAHSLYAMLEWIARHPDEARRHLQAALASNPRAAGVHQRLGVMALSGGRTEEAVREFRKELEVGPASSELYLLLGRATQQLGDRKAARDWYRRAIEIDPENAMARDSLAAFDREGVGR